MIRLPQIRRGTLTAVGFLLCTIAVVGCGASAPQPSESSQNSSPQSSSGESTASSENASDSPSSDTQSTVGALVSDFPKTLLPLLPGATVKLSALDKTTTPATASLVGTTNSNSKAIVDFYTKSFSAQGFSALAGGNVGAVISKDFVRKGGKESINLSIVTDGGSTTFTLGASVEAASLK